MLVLWSIFLLFSSHRNVAFASMDLLTCRFAPRLLFFEMVVKRFDAEKINFDEKILFLKENLRRFEKNLHVFGDKIVFFKS